MKLCKIHQSVAILVGLAGFVLMICSTVAAQQTIQLLAGQQKSLNVAGASDIYVGDASIAFVQVNPNQRDAIITGKKPGITSLTITYGAGNEVIKQIQVLTRFPETIIKEIKEIFGEIEGVNFRGVNGKTLAEGKVMAVYDKNRLDQILEMYPEIINMTEDKTEFPMLDIKVGIFEVSKSKDTFYDPQLTTQAVASESRNMFNGKLIESFWKWDISSDLLSHLSYWMGNGKARLIANPQFSISEGDSVRFHSGGEIPFAVHTRDGLAVDWKNYGVMVKIAPTLLGSGAIFMKLDVEASNVDPTYDMGGDYRIPALITRKIKNNLTVKPGETAILGGIYQIEEHSMVKRVPVLGHLLPFLFSKVVKDKDVKEILITVTPNVPTALKISDFPMINESTQKNSKNKDEHGL